MFRKFGSPEKILKIIKEADQKIVAAKCSNCGTALYGYNDEAKGVTESQKNKIIQAACCGGVAKITCPKCGTENEIRNSVEETKVEAVN